MDSLNDMTLAQLDPEIPGSAGRRTGDVSRDFPRDRI